MLLDCLLGLLRSSRRIEHSRRVLEGDRRGLILLLRLLLLLTRNEGERGLRLDLNDLLRLRVRRGPWLKLLRRLQRWTCDSVETLL